ncbi:MAG: hypothetical protein UY67_C0001G0067 [Candidatus Kaiserbacteria bacterium GW2011_GWA2_52_12]|uniref:PNPLA domain-containing protein n=1 Tax=Candidatus Kaiserbacteria bacterium GW2011_GWA2_52_12 TaxID=1618671 RepID=A0A0G1X2E9_9BACT|nr:MAG: hypothetical protein UY67_C0001G0067 [Candidatus Kaiserbacteria bacterium GW2011_GWA2_52_12]
MRRVKVIENVVVVGDENVVRDLFYPKIIGKNSMPTLRAVIEPGGTKSGLTGGQRFCAFEEMGISASHFDKGLFTSAASCNGIAYAAKQSHMILEYYQKISLLNPHILWSAITRRDYLGLLYLMDELRSTLDVETFRKCPTDITIAVADLRANVHLHKAKEVEDIFDLMMASSALLPDIYGREINGIYSVDGGYTIDSTVIAWLRKILSEIPKEQRTKQRIDLLYIANRPHPRVHFSKLEEYIFHKLIDWTTAKKYPELARGARSIDGKLRKVADLFDKPRPHFPFLRMCALFPMPDENIYPIEMRKKILRTCGELTRMRTEKFLCALMPKHEI